jgi:hypothetical protein
MALGRREASKALRDVVRPQTTGIEERLSFDALHDRARRGSEGTAAVGVEARFRYAIAIDLHRDAHEVATRCASGRAAVRVVPEGALSAGLVEVFGERPH